MVFEVEGDGRTLHRSRAMKGLRGSEKVDIPVAGVDRLVLSVGDGGDGLHCDMANWADARLLPAGPEDGRK